MKKSALALIVPLILAGALQSQGAQLTDGYEALSNVPLAGGTDFEFVGHDSAPGDSSTALHLSWNATTFTGTTADFPPIDKSTISSLTCRVYSQPNESQTTPLVFKLEPQDSDDVPNNHYQDEKPTVNNAFLNYDTGAPGATDLDLYGISIIPVGFGPTGSFDFWIDDITINFTDSSSVIFDFETLPSTGRLWSHADVNENAGDALVVAAGGVIGDLAGPTPGGDKLILPTGWSSALPTPNDGNLMFGMGWEGEDTDTEGTPGTVRYVHVFPITGTMSQLAPTAPDFILPANLGTVDIRDQSKVLLDINVPTDIGSAVDVFVTISDGTNSYDTASVNLAANNTWNNDVEFDFADAINVGGVDLTAVTEIAVNVTGVPDTGYLFFDDFKTTGPAANGPTHAPAWHNYE